MAVKRPYELFGSYLLFKRLDSSRLIETWRAGKIDGGQVTDTVLLHKLTGGDRAALRAAAIEARQILPSITGSTVARNQWADVVDDVPFLVSEYSPGQNLSHIVERSRGGAVHPNPIPMDQALAIAEKLALSLDTLNQLKYQGQRLTHGALLPQFVWVTYDGEVRVSGQQLGPGFIRSLAVPEFSGALGGYFAPELRQNGVATRGTEAYSVAAILHLLLTGNEPPDSSDAASFPARLAESRSSVTGEPLPAELRTILLKGLHPEATSRYASPDELRQALGPLLHGGAYTPTTFNLAFYLSSLLRKEVEAETLDREKEALVAVAPYLEQKAAPAPIAAPVASAPHPAATPVISHPGATSRSRMPIAAVIAGIVLLAGGAGAWMVLGRKTPAPAPAPAVQASAVPAPAAPPVVIQPIVESVSSSTAPPTGTIDPEAQKKAFEDAVNKKLQAEMMKLQEQHDRQLAARTPAAVPQVASRPVTPPPSSDPDRAGSAAQLDQQRRAQQEAAAVPAPAAAAETAPAQPSRAIAQPEAVPVATVNEGDLVDLTKLDRAPKIIRSVKPTYPVMATRRKIEGDVILSALISPAGRVMDVKVLRGDDKRVGFEESAMQAVRKWQFSPAQKDGKNVKTWIPVAINFKL